MPGSDRRIPSALLLTAGLGTRLQPLTSLRAKPAVPINGAALVHRILRWLSGAGIRDFVLNLHHRPASITSLVGDGTDAGVRVRYSWEQPVLGSAGGPRHALPLLTEADDDHFLIVNGDTLTDLDVFSLLERHRESGAQVTMALIENPSPEKYGGVRVSSDGWVAGFTSRKNNPPVGSYHFIGVQVAQARAFADLADGVPFESVGMLYPRLMAENPKSIAAHVSRASFLDVGTPADYLDTSLSMAEVEGPRLTGRHVETDRSAILDRTVVWDDVTVGRDARLSECVVGDGVRIPEGANYHRCAIIPAGTKLPEAGERIEGGLLLRDI
jgi:NDP-sugar pyrophosphorylase family protein